MNDEELINPAPRRPFTIVGHEAEAVVRRVWGSVDTVMLIFAGSAAEFAVNKAVDWLFWTNALPSAPIKRFFETVSYAQAGLAGRPPDGGEEDGGDQRGAPGGGALAGLRDPGLGLPRRAVHAD